MPRVPVLVGVSLVAALNAQSTWVVDAARGAGFHYADIPAAIGRAQDGDTIVVRVGRYSAFLLTKGLSILGQGRVVCGDWSRGVTIRGVAAGKAVALHNVEVPGSLSILGCPGNVTLERVTGGRMWILDSHQVSLARTTSAGVDARGSRLAATECRLGDGLTPFGLELTGTNATLAECDVNGGLYWLAGSPAIKMSFGSILALTGNGASMIRIHPAAPVGTPTISGSGYLVLDPRVRFTAAPSTPPLARSLVVIRRTVPYLRVVGGPLGGIVRVALHARPNQPFYLAVGRPGRFLSFPTLWGATWLDLSTAIVVNVGRLDGAGRFGRSVAVPNTAALLGLAFGWQGSAGPSLAEQGLSNPSFYVHGF